MLPPYGLPYRHPPTPLELPSSGFSIIFNIFSHGRHTGVTILSDAGLHPCSHHPSILGHRAPIQPSLTRAFIPIVTILPVDWDLLTVVPSSPSGLGLHPWAFYPPYAIGGFSLGLPSVNAPHCCSATPSWLDKTVSGG
ncbi:hypothetical protein BJY52DRAFT_1194031 [Lactarius psammicola]|nr:hypothetical protein BJY52DRAFT_1194031 [Lactarius psammicola]